AFRGSRNNLKPREHSPLMTRSGAAEEIAHGSHLQQDTALKGTDLESRVSYEIQTTQRSSFDGSRWRSAPTAGMDGPPPCGPRNGRPTVFCSPNLPADAVPPQLGELR